MSEYKDSAFYNDFFDHLEGFKMVEKFAKSSKEGHGNLYIGKIEALGLPHPLSIQVEIPSTFPHNNLKMRTKSLYGYPHLIPESAYSDESWFCLNTPFAETAHEQLCQEILRLRGWISRYVRPDLPAIIEDPTMRDALRRANAYAWENIDEAREYDTGALLTFVGDFAHKLGSVKTQHGYLHCVKNGSHRLFAIENPALANFQLPYVIADIPPAEPDFITMREQYGWDNDLCEFLLPGMELSPGWHIGDERMVMQKRFSEEEALSILADFTTRLDASKTIFPQPAAKSTESLSDAFAAGENRNSAHGVFVPQIHKDSLRRAIKSLESEVRAKHGYGGFAWSDLADNEDNDIEEELEQYRSELHLFALGIRNGKDLSWRVCATIRAVGEKEEVKYDLHISGIALTRYVTKPMSVESCPIVNQDMYFGRGMFSEALLRRRICIVGVGAIGSLVAEALARSGAAVLGLWDNDIVEPGNICRSAYTVRDLGEAKVRTIKDKITAINPFVSVGQIKASGSWMRRFGAYDYEAGAFYGSVNYNSQEKAIEQLQDYDLIIDCSGSNELLHFLSYAVPDKDVLSLCITNHASDLLMVSNRDGNPFELRKLYLSRIEQDTKNFYAEGSGCYSPTFLAKYSDICALVGLVVREVDAAMCEGCIPNSVIWSYCERGIVADRLQVFKLPSSDIRLVVSKETILDGLDLAEADHGVIGHLFGSYSRDGKLIMVSHIVSLTEARTRLENAFNISGGIIDYLGDYVYSDPEKDSFKPECVNMVAAKAVDADVNINNPVLAVRNTDNTLSFYLWINGELTHLEALE